ncbi:MAG: histidine phosphatase family protein [Alphaproteobacteria bacterium]|nr:histidine phosphatase family protein [Alphaproteobacteria bacterium]
MTRVLVIRHGHVDGIQPPRFRGRFDVPLSAEGLLQAAATAEQLAKQGGVSAVYTSPLARCVTTAETIATACEAPCIVEDNLADLDYGSWQWRSHEDIRQEAPEHFARWFSHPEQIRFPEGESLQDLVARTADVIRDITKRHPADTVALVGHDSVNRAILMQMLDQPLSAYWRLSFSPCSVSEFEVTDSKTRVTRINDTSHLR